MRPDRRVQPADEGRSQQGAGAAAEEADWPEGLDDGRPGLPRRSGEQMDATQAHKQDAGSLGEDQRCVSIVPPSSLNNDAL